MTTDDEIRAMAAIAAALEPLEDPARGRALRWATSRYGGTHAVEPRDMERDFQSSEGAPSAASPFESFAELFDAANPRTEKDKALVAAYWIQVCQEVSSFPAQSLNNELKDLGHQIGNITEALTQLKRDRPALVLQLKKSGTSRQARKTYKLTQEGARRVQVMTQGGSTTESKP